MMTWIVGIVCFVIGFLVADFLVYRRRYRSDLVLRKTVLDIVKGITRSQMLPPAEGETLDRLAELHGVIREEYLIEGKIRIALGDGSEK